MPRLIGITVLLLSVLASLEYSFANAPQARAEATATLSEEASPVEALTEASAAAEEASPRRAAVTTWSPAVYTVGDTDEVRTYRSDRDVEPRGEVISDDVTFEESNIPSSAQRLGGELEPGLYATSFEAERCTYELWQVLRTRRPAVIAEEYLARGRVLVSINEIEPDWFSSTRGCGEWRRWEPLEQPLTRADNGDYWIGDLAAGAWDVPAGCVWEKVVAFRGAELADVEESGGPGQPLVVDDDTLGVRVRGCRAPLTLAEPGAATEPVSSATGDR